MNIAHLRAITRRLGGSHLALRPDGIHLKLDEKQMPDPQLLFDALAKTDSRLVFGGKKVLELIVKQPGLSPLEALAAALSVFDKLLKNVLGQQKDQPKEECHDTESSAGPSGMGP